MDVSDPIKNGEDEAIEFKRELNDSMYKTLFAFANTAGGILLLGDVDDGKVFGFSGDLDGLARSIRHNLGINPSIKAEEIDGKKIVIIEVSQSSVPVSFRGRYYRRVVPRPSRWAGRICRGFSSRNLELRGILCHLLRRWKI